MQKTLVGIRAVWMATGLAVMFGLILMAAPARAADKPFEIQFDQSDVRIGALGDLLGSGGLPLGEIASGGSISGTIAPDGKVTIPKGSFKMPEIGIDDPVKVRLFLGIEGPATGTFNAATGQLELDTQAGLWLRIDAGALLDLLGLDIGDLLGGSGGGGTGGINIGSMLKPMLSNLTCGFSPMDVHFTTGSNSLASGTPFTDGPAGLGAITTEWSQLGPFKGQTKLLGLVDPCQMLLDFLPGLIEGGVGGALPGGVDLGGLDLAGLLSNLNNLNLGPSSITLTRSVLTPDPPIPPIAGKDQLRIKVTALDRRVNRPWKARYRVRVRNAGDGKATGVKACITGFAVKRSCFKLGSIGAGKVKTKLFRARVIPKRLNSRRQQVLRPLFTVTAKGMKPVKRRQSTTRLIGA